MDRRKYLLLAGSSPLLSGCMDRVGSVTGSGGSGPPEVLSERVEILDGECVAEPMHSASATFDEVEHELTVEGVVATVKPCLRLALVVDDGAGYEDLAVDDFRVEVMTLSPLLEEDCDRCPSDIEYSARVRFDDQPRSIEIYHDDVEENKLVGPLDSV